MSGFGQLDVNKWLELTKKPPKKKIEKEKPIVYPIFDQCAKYVKEDIEWHNVFKKASRGRLKKSFKYDQSTNTLYYTYYKKKEILNISEDPVEATKQIVDFIQKNDGFYSKKDKKRAKNYKSKYRLTSWSDINSPIKKNHLIDVFVVDFCTREGLDVNEYYPIVKSFINKNIIIGNIGKENIELNNEKISNIDVFYWNKEKNYPYIVRLTKKRKKARKKNKVVNDNTLLVPCDVNNLINPPIDLRSKMVKCHEQYVGKRAKPTKNEIKTNGGVSSGGVDNVTNSATTNLTSSLSSGSVTVT